MAGRGLITKSSRHGATIGHKAFGPHWHAVQNRDDALRRDHVCPVKALAGRRAGVRQGDHVWQRGEPPSDITVR
jgi:hypothetical protein